jgi:hypothetical protein
VQKNLSKLNPMNMSSRKRQSAIGGLGSSISKLMGSNEKSSFIGEVVDEKALEEDLKEDFGQDAFDDLA